MDEEMNSMIIEQIHSEFPELPNAFDDDYVKREIAWYNAPKDYDEGEVRLINKPLVGRVDDYLNVNVRIDESLVVPVFFVDGTLFMSLTPMEVQSAAFAIFCAHGDVATAGLGMGYFALKCAAKDSVTKVTVYEQSEDVIKYFNDHFSDREGFEKIEIVHGDARETLRERAHGFLYVDTYADMTNEEIAPDIELYASENEISEYWFWGIERVILSALVNGQIDSYDIPREMQLYFAMWQQTEAAQMRFDASDDDYC